MHSFFLDFLSFGYKQARASLFAGLFFGVLFLSKSMPLEGVMYRYDFILVCALGIQAIMLMFRLENWQEFRMICLFHVLGFLLEVFKTHPSIGSWSYPENGISKVFGVPLYSGFMYAAVASYMCQSWKLLHLRYIGQPSFRLTIPLVSLIYVNFFTKHFIGDWRWIVAVGVVVIFRKTWVLFTPREKTYRMPMLLAFVLIGFFVWIAENIATFFGAWKYPNQHFGWEMVDLHKISSWGLLVIMTFIIVLSLYDRTSDR